MRIGSIPAAPFAGDQFASLYLGAERVPTVPGKPVVTNAFQNVFAVVQYGLANDGGLPSTFLFFFNGESEDPASDGPTEATFDDRDFTGEVFQMRAVNAIGEGQLSDPVVIL
jgi:hypothetical protein